MFRTTWEENREYTFWKSSESEEEIENLKNLVVDAGRKNMLAATNLNQGRNDDGVGGSEQAVEQAANVAIYGVLRLCGDGLILCGSGADFLEDESI